jgi:hypothetical protein
LHLDSTLLTIILYVTLLPRSLSLSSPALIPCCRSLSRSLARTREFPESGLSLVVEKDQAWVPWHGLSGIGIWRLSVLVVGDCEQRLQTWYVAAFRFLSHDAMLTRLLDDCPPRITHPTPRRMLGYSFPLRHPTLPLERCLTWRM